MDQIMGTLKALLQRQRPDVQILAERSLEQQTLVYGHSPNGDVELLFSGRTPDSASILLLGNTSDREGVLKLIEQDVARRSRPPAGRIWQCLLCSFVYEEVKGHPETGIPPGTAWEDLAENWCCPECGAVKGDFMMVEVSG